MAISVIAIHPNQTIPDNHLLMGGITIFSGVVECLFKGDASSKVIRDTLTFDVGPVNLASTPPIASCTMSLASFAFDGVVNSPLWAVDGANVQGFVNADRGSETAHLEVVGNLAVRGETGIILRVNYIVFYSPS